MRLNDRGKQYMAGGILFAAIVVLGIIIVSLIRLYHNLPSGQEVMDIATDFQSTLPTKEEVWSGSWVPGSTTTAASETNVVTTLPTDSPSATSKTWLTAEQRRVLAKVGIDESRLPNELSPALEACLVAKLGSERFDQIKQGDTPTVTEGVRAIACL